MATTESESSSTAASESSTSSTTTGAPCEDNPCACDVADDVSDGCNIENLVRLVFVTSAQWNGAEVGGVAGADAKCNAFASKENLGGTFKAWLSSSKVQESAVVRMANSPLKGHIPIRMDGKWLVANDANENGEYWDDFLSNWWLPDDNNKIVPNYGRELPASITQTEKWPEAGSDLAEIDGYVRVWSGTYPDGEAGDWYPDHTWCDDWTTSNSKRFGHRGDIKETSFSWSYSWTENTIPYSWSDTCNQHYRLICIQYSLN